jgi:hypothetical protein
MRYFGLFMEILVILNILIGTPKINLLIIDEDDAVRWKNLT